MANPTKLTWVGPTTYVDGSAFGAADLAGYEILVNDAPAVNVPMAWNEANVYEFDIALLGLGYGTHQVRLVTVAQNGQKSVPSNALAFTLVDERTPNPPTSLQAV